jgi:hypothetical protein
MPITGTFTLEELIAEILKQDHPAVLTALQKSAQPIFQGIFDKGHAAATQRYTAEKATLDGTIANLTTQNQQKDEQIRQLGEAKPDVVAMQTKHAADIQRLEDKHKNELKVANDTLIGERMSRTGSDLKTKLVVLGVDAEYAEVVVSKAEREKRWRPNAKGIVEIFRADTDAPYAPAQGKDALDLLAEELKTAVPPKFITVNGDSGSGTTTSTTGAATGKKKFDNIREDVKKKEAASASTTTAAQRLAGGGGAVKTA